MSAHLLAYRREDDAREAAAAHLLAHPEQQTRHSIGINLLHYAIIQSLPQTRHANKDSHLATAQRRHDVRSRHRRTDSDTTAHDNRRNDSAHERQNVMHRQENQCAAVLVEDMDAVAYTTDVRIQIRKRQHHTLRRPRCARGIYNQRRSILGSPRIRLQLAFVNISLLQFVDDM